MSDALGFNDGLNDRWRGAVDAHKAHAEGCWPEEACGLIGQDGEYLPRTNLEPRDPAGRPTFRVGDLRDAPGGYPAALLHSHTSETEESTNRTLPPKDSPSAADMQSQMDTAIPWGISLCVEGGATDPFWFGDQVPRPPLYGRSFRHGVSDCYALIRDWHLREAGLRVPDFPRDEDWWETNPEQDLYMAGFESAGFKLVDRAEGGPLPGDVFLCHVRSSVINHGGVYLGDGLIGHHLHGQLSRRDPASVWRPKLNLFVRHANLPEDWAPESKE